MVLRTMLQRLSAALNRIIGHLLAGLGLSMALVIGVQVFCRYVLNHSLFWSEELARAMLVWLTFLGATVAWYRRLHPGIDLVTRRLPPSLQRLADLLVQLVAMALFAAMVIAGCRYGWFIRHQISPALAMPRWITPAVIPLSGLVLLVHSLATFPAGRNKRDRDR